MSKGHFIFYLKEKKLVSNGCIYNLVRVNESSAHAPSLQSVSIVKEFQEVFPDDLPGVQQGREIDFYIDVILDTFPIFNLS